MLGSFGLIAWIVRFFRSSCWLLAVAGQSTAQRALPVYFAPGIAASVLFGGDGLDAKTGVTMADQSRPSRLCLLVL
ncbi:hypothetical protein ACFL5O_04120 [Myxococcota bacterium]